MVKQMKKPGYLGELEQMVLLAVLQLGENAYGTAVMEELMQRVNRKVSRGALYVTLDRLEELVMYYDSNGMITGNNTTRILLDRLERARRFHQNGKQDAYMSQLQAFIDQIYDFSPQFITCGPPRMM